MKVSHRCWAEVDLDALRENLAWIRHRVGSNVKIMTVVKADAYGHGLKPIAALLMQSGTDIFGVANLTEARHIRTVGKGWPILMLGACLPEEVALAVKDEVRPTISSLAEAKAFQAAASKAHQVLPIHLKVDTGMGRLGAPVAQAEELVAQLLRFSALRLEGIYTHFCSVEDDAEFSRLQATQFQQLLARLHANGISPALVHANNSGALLHEPDTMFNLVRPGLLVYGVLPPGQRQSTSGLRYRIRPALSWKCRVSLAKEIPKGTALSYGRTFIALRKMRVATLTAGYGDGYVRAGSNRAQVLIGGKRCRIIGRITMDQMLADISRVPEVHSGDEAVLIGEQGNQQISAQELAEHFDTVPWEVLTNIAYRVPRIYRGGSAA